MLFKVTSAISASCNPDPKVLTGASPIPKRIELTASSFDVGTNVAIINNNIRGDKKKERKKRAEQEVMERGRIAPFGREPPVALNLV